MIRTSVLLLAGAAILAPSSGRAEPLPFAERLAEARGAEYRSLRDQAAALPAAERSQLAEAALRAGPEGFEAAGLVLAALDEGDHRAECRSRIYDLRGLDAERLSQRRRKDPEAASHLRSAVRNGCAAFVLELALRPELYDLEGQRSLAPEQRAALDRGLVIALGSAEGAAVIGYLASRARDLSAPTALRRRALEAYGQAAGPMATAELRLVADDARALPELRAGALVGLGLSRDPAAKPSLAAALRHPDPELAGAALVGLSALASPSNERASDGLRRQISAELVAAFAAASPEHGARVLDALAFVAHPSVMEDLERLRGVSGDARIETARRRLTRALARSGVTAPSRAPAAPSGKPSSGPESVVR